MKKNLMRVGFIASTLIIAAAGTSCAPKDANSATETQAKATTAAPGELPNYRYVDIDSVMAHYHLAKDIQERTITMQRELENTARQKSNSLESYYSNIQRKYANIQYPTALEQQQMQQEMNSLENMRSSVEREMMNLQNNYQTEFENMQKAVKDSIDSYIENYNALHNYDAIFMKQSGLYFDPRLDITPSIIDGLNKRYNKK